MTYASGPSFSLFSADSRRSGISLVIHSFITISLSCYAYRRQPSVALKSGPYSRVNNRDSGTPTTRAPSGQKKLFK